MTIISQKLVNQMERAIIEVEQGTTSPIIIVGMHRSGTSLLAHILTEMGLHIGNQLDMHNESVLFKYINNRLLVDVGASWFHPEPFLTKLEREGFVVAQAERAFQLFEKDISQYGQVKLKGNWGWKDPRNILTLPIWMRVFPAAKVINIERHGIDVSLSLQRREIKRIPYWLLGLTKEKGMFPPTLRTGYKLWHRYLQIAQSLHNHHPRWMSIRYEDLLLEPEKNIVDLQKFLDLDVAFSRIEWIAKQIVQRPTSRSFLEDLRVQMLLKLGLLALQPLYERGYKVFGE